MPNTLYPTQVDSWSDPVQTTGLADAGYEHDIAHDRLNDSVIALETNVGIHLSPVTSTIDYILRNHQHSGADSSAILASLSARPVTDGTVLNLQTAAGVSVITASSASAGPTQQISPPSTTTVGQVIKQQASASADFVQWQNSAGSVLAGVNSAGALYSTAGLTLQKGVGGVAYFSTIPATGEIDYPNGPILKGFSGAVGSGQQYQMNMATGQLFLGANSGTPSLVLNNWSATRSSSIQMIGKDNADSGLTSFLIGSDADGQIMTARSMVVQGNLAKTATGVYIGTDNFFALSYPTYDGVTTYTKAAGVSVQPGVNPPLTVGTFSIAGALSTSGNATVGGSLSVTGALTATAATTSLSSLSVSGNATVGGTLGVTGATTLAALSATTITATGTSSLASVTASGTLNVTGTSTLASVTASGTLNVTGIATLTTANTTTVSANKTGTAGRYVGVTSGSPTGGPYSVGDFANDPTNAFLWMCTAAGSPGTWAKADPGYQAHCRLFRAGTWTTATTPAQFNFDSASYDPLFMGGAGVVTIKIKGYYRVTGQLYVPFTSTASGDWLTVYLYHGATEISQSASLNTTGAQSICVQVNDTVQCAVNDTISIQQASNVAVAGGQGTQYCYIAVDWVGAY